MESKKIDQHTINEAWSTMRATLDKEMPEKKKRRAIFWMPILAGALLVAAWYFIDMNQNEIPQQIKKAPTQIQNEPPLNPNQNKTMAATEISKEDSSENKQQALVSQEIEKSNTISAESKNEIQSSNIQIVDTDLRSVAKKATPIQRPKISQAISIQKKIANQNPLLQTTDIEKQNKKLAIENIEILDIESKQNADKAGLIDDDQDRPKIEVLPAIPTLGISTLQGSESEFVFSDAIDLTKKSKWGFGIRSIILSNLNLESPTFMLEGVVQRRLSSKWSLSSGLGFKRQSLILNEVLSDRVSPSLTDTDISVFSEGLESPDAFALSSGGKFNHLSLYVPLRATFHLKNRWSMTGGASFNLTLQGRWGAQSNSMGDFLNVEQSISLSESRTTKASHFTLDYGLEYSLSPKLSLGILYQYNTRRFEYEDFTKGAHQVGVSALLSFQNKNKH